MFMVKEERTGPWVRSKDLFEQMCLQLTKYNIVNREHHTHDTQGLYKIYRYKGTLLSNGPTTAPCQYQQYKITTQSMICMNNSFSNMNYRYDRVWIQLFIMTNKAISIQC